MLIIKKFNKGTINTLTANKNFILDYIFTSVLPTNYKPFSVSKKKKCILDCHVLST